VIASVKLPANYPATAQQYLGFKFTFSVGDDNTKTPVFTGYQVKALPAIPRQRLIQYPVFCYDHEMDKFGVTEGYEGSAWNRMSQLESVENVGDTSRVQDFRTGESYVGLIEEIDFINRTPTDKRVLRIRRRFAGYNPFGVICVLKTTAIELLGLEVYAGSIMKKKLSSGELIRVRKTKELNKKCSLDSCDKPHRGLGYCRGHYQRVKKFGNH
jgi:hypothetical protein